MRASFYMSMPRKDTDGDEFSAFHIPTILDGVIVTCIGDDATAPPLLPCTPAADARAPAKTPRSSVIGEIVFFTF